MVYDRPEYPGADFLDLADIADMKDSSVGVVSPREARFAAEAEFLCR